MQNRIKFIDTALNVYKKGNNSHPWPLHSKHANSVLTYIPPNTTFFFKFHAIDKTLNQDA
jgi:hypothetical protein